MLPGRRDRCALRVAALLPCGLLRGFPVLTESCPTCSIPAWTSGSYRRRAGSASSRSTRWRGRSSGVEAPSGGGSMSSWTLARSIPTFGPWGLDLLLNGAHRSGRRVISHAASPADALANARALVDPLSDGERSDAPRSLVPARSSHPAPAELLCAVRAQPSGRLGMLTPLTLLWRGCDGSESVELKRRALGAAQAMSGALGAPWHGRELEPVVQRTAAPDL